MVVSFNSDGSFLFPNFQSNFYKNIHDLLFPLTISLLYVSFTNENKVVKLQFGIVKYRFHLNRIANLLGLEERLKHALSRWNITLYCAVTRIKIVLKKTIKKLSTQ